jgi:hypothetical protein
MRLLTTCLFALFTAAACAPSLLEDHPFDGQGSALPSGPLVSTQPIDGGTLMNVDATNKGSQVYVDFDQGVELKADVAFATNDWDLSFKRFEVTMNGGTTNPAGLVSVAVLKGQDYDALTQAPASGFGQDGSSTVFAGVEGGWYNYDLSVHKVLAKADLVYVLKSSKGTYFKLKMLEYYDLAGTPASITLKYAPIAAP